MIRTSVVRRIRPVPARAGLMDLEELPMTELMAPTAQPNPAPPPNRPHRRAFDDALAALVVVSVLGNIAISHRLVAVHTRATALATEIAELGRLAHEVDEPGNDVFSSREVERERNRLDAVVPRFDAALARLASASFVAAADVDTTRKAMQTLVGLAREVLEQVPGGDLSRAAELMAAMDRANARLATVLAATHSQLLAARPVEVKAVPASDPSALSLSLADPPSDTARRRDAPSPARRAA